METYRELQLDEGISTPSTLKVEASCGTVERSSFSLACFLERLMYKHMKADSNASIKLSTTMTTTRALSVADDASATGADCALPS